MSPRLAFALDAAARAGDSTLGLFHAGPDVERKEDDTPVTRADRDAERLFRTLVQDRYPGEHVLGEEEGGEDGRADRWVVDPIDGTKSFLAGVPLYSTLVSYEVDRRPVVGVVHFPALGKTLYAEKGSGAFLNGRPVRARDLGSLRDAILCCGGHRHMALHGRMEPFLTLARECLATRTWGDAYGHALVATGRAHAMCDPTVSRWDVSALALVVPEAGATFATFDGGDALTPVHADGHYEALSCVPGLVDRLREAFAR